jgi:iron complex transport system substrate-binding protein
VSSRIAAANAAGVIAALGLAVFAAAHGAPRAAIRPHSVLAASLDLVDLPGGRHGLRDATGQIIELAPYHRLVAASTVADRLLHELAEPDRLVGVTSYGRAQSPWAYQLADKPTLASIDDVEAVLSLRPDLVVLNSYGQLNKVTRLRERGIAVFDLGEMRGAELLVRDIRIVAQLIGHPERGERLVTSWQRRFAAIAGALGDRSRKRALYLSTYGGKLFGGTRGSSYGDVLQAAGLVDAAAAAYLGWPQYEPEQLLRLDPEVIVTKPGMAIELCRVPGLDQLRACRTAGAFVEVDGGLLDDPGLSMLDTAEQIFAAAYPATGSPGGRGERGNHDPQ